jgi:low temperature requirement protein LtrA
VLHLIIILALVGLALWAVNAYVPMDPKIKNILNIVVVIVVVLWLLSIFGLLSGLNEPVPRLH